MEQSQHSDRLIIGGVILMFALVVAKQAWLSDDAGLTLRTVDNLLNGYGPTWNVAERVQAYTHPLWMLLLAASAAITGEYYLTTIAVGLICSLLAVLVLARLIAASHIAAVVALLTLILAPSFVDYSTSGLENSLAHLLLAAFAVLYLRRPSTPRAVALLSGVSGLLLINRQDHLLLIAPAVLVVVADLLRLPGSRARFPAIRLDLLLALALGALPLLLWHSFSLVYYGFPFPNTAYAKLNTGIDGGELARQGVVYLLHSLEHDPLTLLAIAAAIVLPFGVRHWRAAALAIGIACYLGYIVRIGGDFMSGRFLTAPLMLAAILIAYLLPNTPRLYLAAALVLVVGLANPRNPLFGDLNGPLPAPFIPDGTHNGIVDERRFYVDESGVVRQLRDLRRNSLSTKPVDEMAARVSLIWGSVGMVGLDVGPEVHIIDVFALSEPLLARLPAAYDPYWRVGHFWRTIPQGYVETLESGENRIADPQLAAYYDQLRLATRGDLFDPRRWSAIWALNSGALNHLIDPIAYRYPAADRRTLAEVDRPAQAQPLPLSGALIELGRLRHEPWIELELGKADRYELIVRRDGAPLYRRELPNIDTPLRRLDTYRLALPTAVAQSGYDTLHVLPRSNKQPQLGGLRLLNESDPPAPQIRLGAAWSLSLDAANTTWQVGSPATIIVDAVQAQPYRLDLTPIEIFDPQTQTMGAGEGRLLISAGDSFSTTVPITRDQPVSVYLDLPAGRQSITLSLLDAADQVPPIGNRTWLGDKFLTLTNLSLYEAATFPMPAGILIDGQPQQAAPGQVLLLPANGWYPYEPGEQLRWSSSPATLQIYSPDGAPMALKLTTPLLFDGRGLGERGELLIRLNDDPLQRSELWTWQPAVIDLALRPGWNEVSLELAAGAFRPSEQNGASGDTRLLSFAVRTIELVSR